jgi:hypothetical protein
MTTSQTKLYKKLRAATKMAKRTSTVPGAGATWKERDINTVVIRLCGHEFEMAYRGSSKDCRWYRTMFLQQLRKYIDEEPPTKHRLGPKQAAKGTAERRTEDGG